MLNGKDKKKFSRAYDDRSSQFESLECAAQNERKRVEMILLINLHDL